MSSKTRLEATADAAADYIMAHTGIVIKQPPLGRTNDCTVRLAGDTELSRTLDGSHGERELRLVFYCKSSQSRAGIHNLTQIQELFAGNEKLPEVNDDITYILGILTGDISEENLDGEWIYRMTVAVRYCY